MIEKSEKSEDLIKLVDNLKTDKKGVKHLDWNEKEMEVLGQYSLLTSKPIFYLLNMRETACAESENNWLHKIKVWIDENDPGATVISFSPALKDSAKFRQMDEIIKTVFRALQLSSFFTAGEDEVRSWTFQNGIKAPKAAGKIHTGFEKGFIMAELFNFKDFKDSETELDVKAAGKYRQEGKEYVIEDGDIVLFKFNFLI